MQFGKDPMEIVKVNGSRIVLVDVNGKQRRRNSSHVKKYFQNTPQKTITCTEDDDSSATPIYPRKTNLKSPTCCHKKR